MRKISRTCGQTGKLAESLAKKIISTRLRKSCEACVIALSGDLGAGKTVFVQGFAKALGIKDKITSPTFVILKKFKNLVHIDAYRIDNPKEILYLGWEELVNNPENIILVEWAEKVKKILPKNTIWIKFEHLDEKRRIIDFVSR
ncbi:tRNA (adenosine(37)-N6)-threonylcarbamoyltransferase complex ATPase subunit type 1 TsaE [Patescibacteria group bacterium]|nr:tRNA (adenosine(37)-N6)-threonylcarbamoyltransferase complex ATPase subunit type 1 TsaE [Patescibacteria group bacterium]